MTQHVFGRKTLVLKIGFFHALWPRCVRRSEKIKFVSEHFFFYALFILLLSCSSFFSSSCSSSFSSSVSPRRIDFVVAFFCCGSWMNSSSVARSPFFALRSLIILALLVVDARRLDARGGTWKRSLEFCRVIPIANCDRVCEWVSKCVFNAAAASGDENNENSQTHWCVYEYTSVYFTCVSQSDFSLRLEAPIAFWNRGSYAIGSLGSQRRVWRVFPDDLQVAENLCRRNIRFCF